MLLFFNNMLLHCSYKVDAEQPRRAYRVCYQSFDKSVTPRGTPIVLSLEEPEALKKRYDYETSLPQKVIRKVGKRLVHWGE